MKNPFRYVSLLTAAILISSFASGLAPRPALAQGATPRHAMLVLLDSAGRVLVDDPLPSPHTVWTSGSTSGYMRVATGRFRLTDSDQIVAARPGNGVGPGLLTMYDLTLVPGGAAINVDWSLPVDAMPYQMSTGDFDRDGQDEVALLYTTGGSEYLNIYDSSIQGTTWTRVQHLGAWGFPWQDMSAGDINGDGYDDLALVRQVPSLLDFRLLIYNGKDWTKWYESPYGHFGYPWLAVAIGKLSPVWPAQQIILSRDVGQTVYQPNSELIFEYDPGTFNVVDITPSGYYHYPGFTSLALADLNGDGEHEIVVLRDPLSDTGISLLVENPAGAAIPAFQQSIGRNFETVRAGDFNGDGKDEIVVQAADRYLIYKNPTGNPADIFTVTGAYYTSNYTNDPTLAVLRAYPPVYLLYLPITRH